MFPWSVMPRAGWPSATAAATKSPTRAAPSNMENSVWVCRCVNDRSDTGPPFATSSQTYTCVIRPGPSNLSRRPEPHDDRSGDLVVQRLALRVPEWEKHVEQPDHTKEDEEELDEAQRSFDHRPDQRPPVPEHLEGTVPDGPQAHGHHAHGLASLRPAEHGAVHDVEHARDDEGQGRDVALLSCRAAPRHQVHLEGVAVAEHHQQDDEHNGENHRV